MRDDIPLRECVNWLRRCKPAPIVSLLVQQLGNFDANPDAMRPKILETIDRLAARAQ